MWLKHEQMITFDKTTYSVFISRSSQPESYENGDPSRSSQLSIIAAFIQHELKFILLPFVVVWKSKKKDQNQTQPHPWKPGQYGSVCKCTGDNEYIRDSHKTDQKIQKCTPENV